MWIKSTLASRLRDTAQKNHRQPPLSQKCRTRATIQRAQIPKANKLPFSDDLGQCQPRCPSFNASYSPRTLIFHTLAAFAASEKLDTKFEKAVMCRRPSLTADRRNVYGWYGAICHASMHLVHRVNLVKTESHYRLSDLIEQPPVDRKAGICQLYLLHDILIPPTATAVH